MNILKRELRAGLKTFIFWSVALGIIVMAGMTKFTGVQPVEGGGLNDLLAAFPRVVLAVMGMANVDVTTLGGYYSVLAFYALLCASIYAVHLGVNAVSREAYDKTYEFLFTKPRSRCYILRMKLISMWIFLLVFCVLNGVFSVAALKALKISGDLTAEILLFSVAAFLVGSIFLSLGAFLSALAARPDRGSMYGNFAVVFAFIMGVVCDMLDNGAVVRFFTPLKYFAAAEILKREFSPLFTLFSAVLIAVFLIGTFRLFKKKDLKPA
jgi:ABC-2 type transport system permease protein